ncbi:hypothetical protein J010_03392 [Cryptococcus neoformans]|nr:hypothetical protein C355_03014 [Cryptococcus neoformans var. grubii Th84]OXH10446.1 hypothetical protein J010_03392 [Cryptococcus neoformans var. grubii]OXH31252.1 hypothetical protein J009_03406 [Cryptococcus neoformans var. grubii]OXH51548.1 hypothetical protein J004_03461 [Cryptococcus neoformans var. grubii]OXH51767.1 hypothetical protein J003_03397 [Cryptococcus neoformans var. grubii]
MNPGGPPLLATQLSPEVSPLYPQSVMHNSRILSSINTLSACFSGLIAGILGLTNTSGFLLYLLSSVATAGAIGSLKCGFDIRRYVPDAQVQRKKQLANKNNGVKESGKYSWRGWWALMGLGQENLLGFLLFWIGSYALIHVYD